MIRVCFKPTIIFVLVAVILKLTSSPAFTQDVSHPILTYKAGSEASHAIPDSQADLPKLIPSLFLTGYGSSDPCIAVARDGSIFYAPAFTKEGTGLLHSRDDGATWNLIIPKFENGKKKGHGRINTYMSLDTDTGRLFFATAAININFFKLSIPGGFDLTWSADRGKTWDYQRIAKDGNDWYKIFTGPPKQKRTEGYPNNVYFTNPVPLGERVPPIYFPHHQAIHRSQDGGKTFEEISQVSLKNKDAPGCSFYEWTIFGSGAVAPDGTIYMGYRRCNHLGIAISGDDGKTWNITEVPDIELVMYWNLWDLGFNKNRWNTLQGEPLTVDSQGNLYVVCPDKDNILRMSISRDKGQTWSQPVVVSAPLQKVYYSAIAAKTPGTVAIAYYGSTDKENYYGYITESLNAFDPQPVFQAATINDAAEPLFPNGFYVGYVAMLYGADVNEFVQVKYAPNGDIWASFVKDMDPYIFKSGLWKQSEHAGSRLQGAIGRIKHVQSGPKEVVAPKAEEPAAPQETVAAPVTVPAVTDKSLPQVSSKQIEIKAHPEEAIKNLVNGWLSSWKSGDIKTYRSFYASDFNSKGINLDAWISYKTNVHRKSKNIDIRIDDLKISLDVNTATAVFTQYYSSSIFKDSGKKILKLKKINDEWKIYREIM